jgi:uncharacterized protein (TIGR02145 family)
MKKIIYFLLLGSSICFSQSKFGSLAIDKSEGFYYGWATDHTSQKQAEERALVECKAKGGNCSIVLSWEGELCAAYRTNTNGKTYGWGIANSKEEADRIAMSEFKSRNNTSVPQNYVWGCNSKSSGKGKVLFDDKENVEKKETFIDPRDGNVYKIINFKENGKLYTWLAENLNYKAENSFSSNEGGRYYSWAAAKNSCPEGWHLPSVSEWNTLISHFGGKENAGNSLKNTLGWKTDSGTANTSGFGATAAGFRHYRGYTGMEGEFGVYWTANEEDSENGITEMFVDIHKGVIEKNYPKKHGFTCRCIKN